MRVCFMSTMASSPWGGSEELWLASALAALDGGHEVLVIVPRWAEPSQQVKSLRARGVVVLERARSRVSRLVRAYERYIKPLPTLLAWKPDLVVISQGGWDDVTDHQEVLRSLNSQNIPYVILCQFVAESSSLSRFDRAVMSDIFSHARHVAFVSERNRLTMERQLAQKLENASVVQNPVNLKDRSLISWPDESVARFGCVALLTLHQNQSPGYLAQLLRARPMAEARLDARALGKWAGSRISHKIDIVLWTER